MEGPLTQPGYRGYPSEERQVGWGRPLPGPMFIRVVLYMFGCIIVINVKMCFVSPGAEGFWSTFMRRGGAKDCLLEATCKEIQ